MEIVLIAFLVVAAFFIGMLFRTSSKPSVPFNPGSTSIRTGTTPTMSK